MAPKRMAPYGGRKLDDGEVVVDCAKAAALFQHSEIPNGEDQAAHELGVTRSVFRRIVGKSGAPWEIVKIENARSFAEKCGSCLKNIEWSGESEAQINNAAPPPITDYLELWLDLHSISLGPYVPLTMRKEDALIDLSGILELMMGTPTLQIIGPSGCGKTHLLAHLATISIDHGFIPIIIQARHFAGRIDAMLDEAVSSATTLRFVELASTCATANVIPVVIIDALNECPPKFRPTLIPTLQELRIRSNARIIISGQTLTELPSSLKGPTILLSLPDAEQKGQLIDAYLKRPLPPDARFALDVISSAHDAMVWAEIWDHSPPGSSRHALYASFARRRLGSTPDADVAYRALRQLAAEMREKFVFSLPKAAAATTIARTIGLYAHEGAVSATIKDSGLLDFASGHVAFRHESLQAFFATENLLVILNNTDALSETLERPINAELVEFTFGSFFSSREVESALARCRSTSILSACLVGRCGPVPKRTVADHCVAALHRLEARYSAASFDYAPKEYLRLTIDMSACPSLDDEDQRYLTAASTPEARLLPIFLAVLGRIDAKLARDRVRLRERYPNERVSWRQCLFTAVHGEHPNYNTRELRGAIHARRLGELSVNAGERYELIAQHLARHKELTPGQLHFLMVDFAWPVSSDSVPTFLYDLAECAWNTGIGEIRLRITIMLKVHARYLSEEMRQRLIRLANSWLSDERPQLNDMVIESLKALDAFDDQFTQEEASAEFDSALALPPSKEASERAFTLYSNIFDHPFDRAYAAALYQMNPDKRMALLARAVETEETNSLPFSTLVVDVARNPIIQVASPLQRVALMPERDTNFIKQSVSYAVIALARIGAPLPTDETVGDAATKAWRLGGKILHIFHQRDITRDEYLLQTEDHWQLLLELDGLDVAMRIIQDRWDEVPASAFCEWSKHQLLRLSRATLARNHALASLCKERFRSNVQFVFNIIDSSADKSYSKLLLEDPVHGESAIKAHAPVSLFSKIHNQEELRSQHLQFALRIIDSYGDRSDLQLIAFLLEHPVHGGGAIKAARSIESR